MLGADLDNGYERVTLQRMFSYEREDEINAVPPNPVSVSTQWSVGHAITWKPG